MFVRGLFRQLGRRIMSIGIRRFRFLRNHDTTEAGSVGMRPPAEIHVVGVLEQKTKSTCLGKKVSGETVFVVF